MTHILVNDGSLFGLSVDLISRHIFGQRRTHHISGRSLWHKYWLILLFNLRSPERHQVVKLYLLRLPSSCSAFIAPPVLASSIFQRVDSSFSKLRRFVVQVKLNIRCAPLLRPSEILSRIVKFKLSTAVGLNRLSLFIFDLLLLLLLHQVIQQIVKLIFHHRLARLS